MSEQSNSAVSSATDDFASAAFMTGVSIANLGAAGLNMSLDNNFFLIGLFCVLASAGAGGMAVHNGLSGLAKLHGEARDAPHPGEPPKIQP